MRLRLRFLRAFAFAAALFSMPLLVAYADNSANETRAEEVTVLEFLSLRVVGSPIILAENISAVTPAVVLEADSAIVEEYDTTGAEHMVATAYGDKPLAPPAPVYYGNYDNDAFDRLHPHQPTPASVAIFGSSRYSGSAASSDSRWRIRGKLRGGMGSATFANRDHWDFELRELYKAANGDDYEFYQRYGGDKSYIDSTLLTIGAKQRLRNWLWDGDLRLREEFWLYRDLDNDANDRQEGRFELRFDPEWDCGRWQADLRYKYRVKVYETFSTRSYRHHDGRLAVERTLSPTLATVVRMRNEQYIYSQGSTRSNERKSIANEWEWEAAPGLTLSAGVESEQKDYGQNTTRSYDKLTTAAEVDWDVDCSTNVELKAKNSAYTRDQLTTRDYDDTLLSLRVKRDFTCELDGEIRFITRSKEYDISPLSNIDENGYHARLNYNPSCDWNYYAGYGHHDYDYATATRAFVRRDAFFGFAHYRGSWRASLDLKRQDVSFVTVGTRDYERSDVVLDVAYRLAEQRFRVYYGVGQLDQSAAGSFNEYAETRLGAEWRYQIDRDVDLKLSYDYSQRDYDALSDLDYSLLAAEIEFEL